MTEQYGYAGKILKVDLSSGTISTTPTSDYTDSFLGGRGIAAKIYWDEVSSDTKAFDPENRMIFALGPLSGTPLIGGSRWQVCGKSPITNPEHFSYCNLGGHWGVQLKFAGYDALVIHGQADKPVYLSIDNGATEIRDASVLWGKTGAQAREMLKEELGNSVRVVTYGPAGENGVPFAVLLADDDATGSNGLASVMGSKKLKAIAVRGKRKIAAAKPDTIIELCNHIRDLKKGFETRWTDAPYQKAMSGKNKKIKRALCYGCIGACIRATYESEDGTKGKFMCGAATFYMERALRYYGEQNDVPFFATKLCDYYGIDADVIYCMLMWLSRCHKSGILNDTNTGMPLSKLGSLEFIDALVKKISLREGFGNILSRGIHAAAEVIGNGAEQLITDYTLKGGNNSAYCPRMYPAHGILYAMEPRQPIQQLHEIGTTLFDWIDWAKKRKGSYMSSDIFRKIAKRFWGSELAGDFSTYTDKALAAVKIQDRQYAKESLILCDCMWPITYTSNSEDHVGDPTIESKLLSAVTGKEISEKKLYKIGERIFNLQRAILTREGHRGRESDMLPEIFFNKPLKYGTENPDCLAPGKGGKIISRKDAVVDREKFEKMKDEYYQLRGWDVASGLQTEAKLKELGLDDIAEDLVQRELAI
ncbi:aldehyde ferredoxin oxidoreductase N-terminal domain-containing protein [Chloroflexota bacterium]